MLHTVNDIKHLTFSLDNFGVYTDQFIMSSWYYWQKWTITAEVQFTDEFKITFYIYMNSVYRYT